MNIVLSLLWFIKEGKLQYRVLESEYLSAWLHKVPTKDSLFFQLRDSGSGLGPMIFHKMSPRAHNYL